MKKLFIASLVFFWTGTVALLVAGIMMYSETKPMAQSGTPGGTLDPLANGFDPLKTQGPSDDDIFVVVGTSTTDAAGGNSTSSGTGGNATQEYTTEQRTVEKPRYLSAAIVAEHATRSDCWIIVDGKVYDVTQYIPFHPGGEGTIISNCGTDATVAFTTKGGSGSHSASAKALLAKYLKGSIGDVWGTVSVTESVRVPVSSGPATAASPSTGAVPAAVKGKFAAGAAVKVSGTVRVRQSPATTGVLVGTADAGLTGKIIGGPTSAGGYVWYNIEYSNGLKGWSVQDYLATNTGAAVATTPATPTTAAAQCTSWTYSSWGSCQSNGTQTRTVKTSSPSGCTGGKPVTTRSCTYVPPTVSTGFTTSAIATHNNSGNCWLIISNKVYDVTQYIPFHPGGQSAITNYCGKDATTAFGNKGGSGSHSASAKSMLANYYVGDVAGAAVTTPTTPTVNQCTSWTYSSWGSCQSNGTQTRTVKTSSPSGCTGGTPVTTQACTYTPPVTTPPAASGALTTSVVATHNSSGSCWLIISNKVYDVTQYIPFHPGGQSAITNYCGKEATTAFATKGGSGSHSSSAQSLLANYYIGDVSSGATTPTTPTVTQCTSWTYNSWGSCQPDGTQTRTVKTSSPSGCTGGSPAIIQACTYTPPVTTPPTSGSLTASVVATHNSSGSCWLIISNKVYDVTQYIPFHPGGQTRIINNCGKDATTVFTSNVSGGHKHSTSATNLLAGYYVGDLTTVTTPPPTTPTDPGTVTCTAWTYSSWGTCQSNGTQSRTVQSSSPSGCTGGAPVTSQSCTYTPPSTNTTYDVTVNSSGSFNQSALTIAVGDSVRFTYTNPGDEVVISFSPAGIASMKLDHERTSRTATFSTAGTWTFSAQGNSGTITVQ